MRDLPINWTMAKLASLGKWGSGGTPKRTNPRYYDGGTIPWLVIGDLNDRIVIRATVHITEAGLANSSTKLLPTDTLLVAMYGSIGKLGITGIECATNQAIAYCRPDEEMSSLRYLFYALMHEKDALIAQGQGGAQQNISQGILKAHEIPVAPLNEQKRIADKLDAVLARVDACRERLDSVPDIIKRFRQAVLAAATSGKLTEDWSGREIPCSVGWRGYPVRNLFELLSEPLRNGKSVRTGDGTPVLRLSALNAGSINTRENKRGQWDGIDVTRFLIHDADFLVSRGNGSLDLVGRGGLVTEAPIEIAFPDTMIRIRVDSTKVLPSFLRLLWDTLEVRNQIESAARTTAGIWNISQTDLNRLDLPIPQLNEQAEIVRRVESLFEYSDRLVVRYAAARARVERLTPALLDKAFRGELVPQDPNDEPALVLLERIRAARAATPAKPRRRQAAARSKQAKKPEVPMLSRKDVPDTHLTNILQERGLMTAESLWSASQLDIDDFYDQLKDEETRGLLRENRGQSPNASRTLEAIA